MPAMCRYRREDMLSDLLDATKNHTGARQVVTWVCDCGCDIMQWFRRTDRGLAFTQQAWPEGVAPRVVIMETRDEVWHLVRGTAMRMRQAGAPEERVKSFEKTVWSAWADA